MIDEQFKRIFNELRVKDPLKLAQVLNALSPQELEAILYDWKGVWARPTQLFTDVTESIILVCAGRSWGKTRASAEWVREMVDDGQRTILLIGPTSADTRDIMVLGTSGILSVFPPDRRPIYYPSKRLVEFDTGAKAIMLSAEEPERVRGFNADVIWADEIGSWKGEKGYDAFTQAMLTLRTGRSQCLISTTPRPTKLVKELFKRSDKDVKLITGTTYDNLHNMSKAFKDQIISQYEGTRMGNQELLGQLLISSENALWSLDVLDRCVIDKKDLPEFKKIVVAVDPSGSNNANSDECGICVAGIDWDDISYIIEDATEKLTPNGWATKVVRLYDKYDADSIVVETNFGAAMCATILDNVRKNLPIKEVHAKKSKMLRAEPVSTLYERDRVRHVKGLEKLETEMTTYEGKGKSPNRLDAAVYAITELMLGKKHFVQSTEFYI